MVNIVVEYAKNLVCGIVPAKKTKTPDVDLQRLVNMSLDMQYVVSTDGVKYWYYIVDEFYLTNARELLRRNGLNPHFHNSALYVGKVPVLRIRLDRLSKDEKASRFVKELMNLKKGWEDNCLNAVISK